jgi:hypothetical protein
LRINKFNIMKKTTLLLSLLFVTYSINSQVLDQAANWDNPNWVITGSYESASNIFTDNPQTSTNFSYDEDEAGNSSINNVAAESPTINLTNAFNAGETWLYVNTTYVLNIYQNETLTLQYWDEDAQTWNDWGTTLPQTTNPPNVNFCNGTVSNFNSDNLNIATFSNAQLSNFKYRIHYNDNGSYGWGFCMSSPTITSQTPPACPNITGLNATNVNITSADIYWQTGNNETSWEIAIQNAGTGAPTGSGVSTSNNNPYSTTGLAQNTNYEVYVRGNCGNGDFSNWIGPENFTTLIGARINFIQQNINVPIGYDLVVVDMNGDFLDDIVAVTSSTNINIHYQLNSGGFSEVNIPTPQANYLPNWSMAAADYDRNGFTDLLYGNGSRVTFLKANNTGTGFSLSDSGDYVFSQRSNFVDINNDGHLDAFVCHDVEPNVYYINDGSGNFTFNQGGLGDYTSGGNYGSIWIDYDNDHDMDMFIAKCGGETARRTDQLLRNNGDGTFTELAASVNLADPMQTWSSTWADYDNDGDMDVFVGASSGTHKLMRNDNGVFVNVTSGAGISGPTGHENVSYDFDNDGFIDIACNGTILYGKGDMTFEDADSNQLNYKNGSFGDLNNDGFIDTYYQGKIYSNGGNGNNWIKINTIGTISNINGIGARVEIHTDAGIQIRDVRSGEGFEFMSSLNTHFGLGSQTAINNIIIYWPSGIIDNIANPSINTTHPITEGATLNIIDETLSSVSIFPNPVTDILNINTSSSLTNRVATVFDINGKRVLNTKLESNSLNVSTLQSGIYFLRLETNGKSIKRKFIKK